MTVHLTDAQEQQLQQLAVQGDRTTDEIAQEAIDRFLLYQDQLLAAVKEGRNAAQRNELLDHAIVVQRIENLLNS